MIEYVKRHALPQVPPTNEQRHAHWLKVFTLYWMTQHSQPAGAKHA